jgi:YD repeat-containing protein
MTFRELIVPSALEVLEIIGMEPVAPEPGSTVRALTFEVDDQNSVSFSYDAAGRSVRVHWKQGNRVVLDLFREGAVLIRFHQGGGGRTSIEVDFETDSLMGTLEVKMAPEVQVKDKLLFS